MLPTYKFKSGKSLSFNKPLVMGVLNITSDSFYDGGKYLLFDNAVEQINKIISEGADIIDIGAESTRPGSMPVDTETEINRLEPILHYLKDKELIISVDTNKSSVAEKSLKLGADIINDISGLKFDSNMVNVIKRYNAGIIIMHIRKTPVDMQKSPFYKNTINEIKRELKLQVNLAISNNIDKIFIDPGIGFGKRLIDNYIILNELKKFKTFRLPLVIGTSRKSMIHKILNISPNDSLPGTIVTNMFAVLKGANILRVHDIKETVHSLKILEYLNNPELLLEQDNEFNKF